MYYIGIDGGGTKSEFVLMDENMNKLSTSVSSATNINSHGYDFVSESIKSGIDGLLEKTKLKISDIKSLCIGSAGVDREEDKINYERILGSIGVNNVMVVNDSEIALSAGTKGEPGVIVISGTGSITYGSNAGVSKRVGGWGHLIGDEGSGYSIAENAIRKALQFSDGYGEKTRLYEELLHSVGGAKASDFIEFIYSESFNKGKIASLSEVVDRLANEGDDISKVILKSSANELFIQTEALIDSLFNETDVINIVFNGSVIKKSKIFRNEFLDLISNKYINAVIIDLNESASVGAVYLAKGQVI